MTQIPKKLDAHSPHYQMINTINQLIDYLHELTSRIDTIAGNQLEMNREDDDGIDWDERDEEHRGRKGASAKDQPIEYEVERDIFGQFHKVPVGQSKRWRAELGSKYWWVSWEGNVLQTEESEYDRRYDDWNYNTGNYHPTREAAEAYKAKLLADNAQ